MPDLGQWHLKLFYDVVVPRIENAHAWVQRHQAGLTRAWQAHAATRPNDASAQRVVDQLEEPGVRDTDELKLNTQNFPDTDEMSEKLKARADEISRSIAKREARKLIVKLNRQR